MQFTEGSSLLQDPIATLMGPRIMLEALTKRCTGRGCLLGSCTCLTMPDGSASNDPMTQRKCCANGLRPSASSHSRLLQLASKSLRRISSTTFLVSKLLCRTARRPQHQTGTAHLACLESITVDLEGASKQDAGLRPYAHKQHLLLAQTWSVNADFCRDFFANPRPSCHR